MECSIERAMPGDAEEVLALQKLAYRSEDALYHDITIPPVTETVQEILAEFRERVVLKAVSEGKIIGSVRAYSERGTCRIGRLIVDPDRQNRGIGTILMEAIEEQFSGCGRFELFTGQKSEKDIYLYGKLGYRLFKTERVSADLTLLYMEKKAAR